MQYAHKTEIFLRRSRTPCGAPSVWNAVYICGQIPSFRRNILPPFGPEEGDSIFLRNSDIYLQDGMVFNLVNQHRHLYRRGSLKSHVVFCSTYSYKQCWKWLWAALILLLWKFAPSLNNVTTTKLRDKSGRKWGAGGWGRSLFLSRLGHVVLRSSHLHVQWSN
jgi:hypothetical protein